MSVEGILGQIESGIEPDEVAIEGLGQSELIELIDGLGAVARRTPARRPVTRKWQQTAGRKIGTNTSAQKGGNSLVREKHDDTLKTKFENRVELIEDEAIKAAIKAGKQTITDYEVYVTKTASGTFVEMVTEADDKATGLSNLNKGQLPSGRVMLVSHIALKEGVGTDPKVVDYGALTANTRNGEFSFSGSQKVLADTVSNEVFHGTPSDEPTGYFRLEAPKFIQNATDIKFDIKLPAAPAANTCFKLLLRGVITTKA